MVDCGNGKGKPTWAVAINLETFCIGLRGRMRLPVPWKNSLKVQTTDKTVRRIVYPY